MTASTEEMRQNGEKMKDKKKSAGQCEEVLRMIGESRMLLAYIEEVYIVNPARFEVLQKIFLEMEHMEAEEMKREIYQYGSMIKGDDLLARQLFLWLLGMTEIHSA